MSAISDAYAAIRTGLRTALWDVSGIPASGYRDMENETFRPVGGTTWVRERLKFDNTNFHGLGSGAGIPVRYRFTGAYMVDLFFPYKTNTNPSDTLVGAVVSAFAPGTTLSGGTVPILIESCNSSGGQDGDGWYMRPIMISWSCDVVQ